MEKRLAGLPVRRAIQTVAILLYSVTLAFGEWQHTDVIHVLFVGNSYTYADDIPWITKELVASSRSGRSLEIETLAVAGATLESHWKMGDVLKKLHEHKWSYVVLQEQSSRPINEFPMMQRYAQLFDDEIKKAGATNVLFMTWPRQQQLQDYDALTNSFIRVANDLNATVAPVAIAWVSVLKRKPSITLYRDGSHPNPVGSYLAACVFYSTLLGKSPVGLSRTLYTARADGTHAIIGEMNEADAALIQEIAWHSVTAMNVQSKKALNK